MTLPSPRLLVFLAVIGLPSSDAPDMQRKKRTLFYLQVLYFLALLVQKCTYWR